MPPSIRTGDVPAAARTVRAGDIPNPARPVNAGFVPSDPLFRFSLQYWQQMELFGLGDAEPKWFIALLDRLKELCKERVSRFKDDHAFKETMHYHAIDWDGRNVPLRRRDFQWLPREILDNETDFPFFQFMVSQAYGRVHGFWDNNCFCIILIDPMHNLQPCAYTEYQVRGTTIGKCAMSMLIAQLEEALERGCNDERCAISTQFRNFQDGFLQDTHLVFGRLSADVADELIKHRQSKFTSFSEIVQYGITFFG